MKTKWVKSAAPVSRSRGRQGFSLPEVMIAMAVFAFIMVSNFALFGLSMRSIKEISGRDEIIRSVPAIQDVIQTMFKGLNDESDPDKAYGWVMNSANTTGTALYAYSYEGEPVVREGTDASLTTELNDLSNRQGGLYRVFLDISVANPEEKAAMPSTWDGYGKSVLVVYAKFYSVGSTSQVVDPAKQTPIYSCTFTCLK